MSLLQWYRLVYAVIACVIFVLIVLEFKRDIKEMSKKQLYWALVIVCMALSTVLITLESLYFNDHLSIRTPLYMASTFWCGMALWVGRKDREKHTIEEVQYEAQS